MARAATTEYDSNERKRHTHRCNQNDAGNGMFFLQFFTQTGGCSLFLCLQQ